MVALYGVREGERQEDSVSWPWKDGVAKGEGGFFFFAVSEPGCSSVLVALP